MRKILIFLLFDCILFSFLNVKAQTYTPASAGNWTAIAWNCVAGTNPCASYPGQTYAGDIVNITSGVTLNSALPNLVGAVTLSNADLTINGSITFSCASIDINASGTGNANLYINNTGTGSPNVNITGNVAISRNTSATSGTKMTIGGGSSATTSAVTIGGNLTYNDNGSGKEADDDISVGSASNTSDQCSLSVTGNISLTFNYSNATANDSGLTLFMNQNSSITTNNLTLTLMEGGAGALNQVKLWGTSGVTAGGTLTVNGNATLSYQDTSSPNKNSYNAINQNQLCLTCNPSVIINGDLYMTSPANTTNGAPSSNPNNRIYCMGTSTFTLNGNVKFWGPTSSTYTMNRIYLTDNAVFNFYGQIKDYSTASATYSITTTNQGAFDFQLLSPYANTSNTIKFLGSAAQNFPGRFGNSGIGSWYKNVVINNSSGSAFTIPTNNNNSTLNIQGTLTLTNGIITSTSTNYVVLDASATCPNGGTASSFVDGPVQKNGSNTAASNVDLIFPTGKTASGTKYWAPIQLSSIAGATSSTTFKTEYFHTPYLNVTTDGTFDHVSQLEYWNITVVGTPTANLTLYWKDARVSEIGDVTTGASQDLYISRYNSGSSQWNLLSPSAINSPSYDYNTSDYTGSITASGLSTFGNFTFGAINHSNNPLPITLSDFNALAEKDQIKIFWMTKSEIDNDKFLIERSVNGKDFYEIIEVKGSGTKSDATPYSTVDNNPINGLSYYRIKQVDYDGRVSYSKVVSVTFEGADLTVYPNPVTQNRFTITVPTHPESALFILTDSFGNEVLRAEVSMGNNPNLEFNTEKLTEGIYFLTLIINDQSYNRKLLVSK